MKDIFWSKKLGLKEMEFYERVNDNAANEFSSMAELNLGYIR